jgi:hypothetical protein
VISSDGLRVGFSARTIFRGIDQVAHFQRGITSLGLKVFNVMSGKI